jgi:Cu2+-exporting ATPase
VVAAGRLLSGGVILKDGAALEKLSEVDTIVFDKTGTLTSGTPLLAQGPKLGDAWSVAMALAGGSRHPLSRALAEAADAQGIRPAVLSDLAERPGFGVEASWNGVPVRLGRAEWVGAQSNTQSGLSEVWLRIGDDEPQAFLFSDELRADARKTVADLQALGLEVRLISGDAQGAVDRVAAQAGISQSLAGCLPGGKVEALEALAKEGRKVLMVGDGLNDAPALAAAHVSMSPASGADIAQAAAGIVFTGDNLAPVLHSVITARKARAKIFSNFSLAIGYNVVAVPIAVLGFATPLIAAVSMSTSSILVIANALTLGFSLRKVGR